MPYREDDKLGHRNKVHEGKKKIDISFGRAAPGFALPEGPAKGVDWAKEKSTTPFA